MILTLRGINNAPFVMKLSATVGNQQHRVDLPVRV